MVLRNGNVNEISNHRLLLKNEGIFSFRKAVQPLLGQLILHLIAYFEVSIMSAHTPVDGKERKMKTPTANCFLNSFIIKNLVRLRRVFVIMSCFSSIQRTEENLKPEGHYVYLKIIFFSVVTAHTRTHRKETTHNEPAGILVEPASSLSLWSGTWCRRLLKHLQIPAEFIVSVRNRRTVRSYCNIPSVGT